MRQRLWSTRPYAVLAATLVALGAAAPLPASADVERADRVLAQDGQPMSFEPNVGQTDDDVSFIARGRGYAIFLTPGEAVLSLDRQSRAANQDAVPTTDSDLRREKLAPSVLRMSCAGTTSVARASVVGLEELPGKSNYLIGNDPSKWHTDVPTFARVRYEGVYDGVDVDFYGNERHLEYDFRVAPGADPSQIRVRFDGAEAIDVDASGALVLRMRDGEIRQEQAVVYQEGVSGKRPVSARYTMIADGEIGFELGGYDQSRTLVIDPVLVYSTFLGGSDFDIGWGIARDGAGSVYVAGHTRSLNFPTAGPIQSNNAGYYDAFVTKAKEEGTGIVYSTYLGGSFDDMGWDMEVDSSGSAYITGRTYSLDFPTSSPIQAVNGGGADAFVAKLNAAGNALDYSTYLGGSSDETAFKIAIDRDNSAYVSGVTDSPNFPTLNPFQSVMAGVLDVFVTKVNPAGSKIVYSTYLGGSNTEFVRGIAVDSHGAAYVMGDTQSPNFPTLNPFQPSKLGVLDVFVTKLGEAGNSIAYSTYLGGSGGEYGGGVALGGDGSIYLTGVTYSTNFPTVTPIQQTLFGSSDVFVTKMNAAGSALVYSTYLGGSGNESTYEIAVDKDGAAYVVGNTYSTNYPTANAVQSVPGGGAGDGFVTALNVLGTGLAYSTYLGGTDSDVCYGITVDGEGAAYVTGDTHSRNFPVSNGFQMNYAGGYDAFIAKLPAHRNRFQFSASSYSINEGGAIAVTVTRTGTLAGTASVNYSTSDNTAIERADYLPVSGILTFPEGVTTQTFDVETLDNAVFEGNRSINLTLTGPSSGATLGAVRRAPLTILEDEPVGPIVSNTATFVDDEAVLEFAAPTYTLTAVPYADTITITVKRTGNVLAYAAVQYATSDNTATAGSDYLPASGFLSFPPKVKSRTFTIRRLAGTPGQGNESLNLTLANQPADTLLGHAWRSVVVIEQAD